MPDDIASRADTLKRRFLYDEWPARKPARDVLFVSNMALSGTELPGLTMGRVRRLEPAAMVDEEMRGERVALRDGSAEAPRVNLQSFWWDARQPDVMIRVDVFECASESDAREKAVWMLGEFESPNIAATDGIGDVAFASRGDRLLLFVRANLVHLLRSIGQRSTETRTAALALDAAVVSTPASRRRAIVSPAVQEQMSAASAIEVIVEEPAPDGQGALVSRKFVAPEGEIVRSGDAIVYRGPRTGLDRLTFYEWP